MLRINVSQSPAQAKHYYTAQLSVSDYYAREPGVDRELEGQEIVGNWGGRLAPELGLEGRVTREKFHQLVDHVNPATGEPLTARNNGANRRVGWDFTFDVDKSVSVYYEHTRDERVLEAFQSSVQETMDEIETEMRVRVRKNGAFHDRVTGNGVHATFTHFTAREVEGRVDPHLHQHVVLFNVSKDEEEGLFKAAEIGRIRENAPYYQAVANARMAKKLTDLGLTVERTRHGFALAGFTDEMRATFSRRTVQIEREAEKLGVTDEREKDGLGKRTRGRKQLDLPMSALREEWRSRLTEREWRSFLDAAQSGGTTGPTNREAVQYGLDHVLERQSVADEKQVLRTALERGVGTVDPDEARRELHGDREVLSVVTDDERRLVSTREVLAEEQSLLDFAGATRGRHATLGSPEFEFRPIQTPGGGTFELSAAQREAVTGVLRSRDPVTIVRGVAGSGKTTLLQEVQRGLRENGRDLVPLAPTAAARDVLRKDGFRGAETVQRFLVDEDMQSSAKDRVLLVDEAGLVGARDMHRLFEVAKRQNARVLLSGDERQHGPIPRCESLALLVERGGVRPIEMLEIRRQKRAGYREAVEVLSRGTADDVAQGFDKLDALGFVHEVEDGERHLHAAQAYLDAVEERKRNGTRKSALVVSPTHAEGRRVTGVIRETLKDSDRLRDDERLLLSLRNRNLTDAEKSDPANYEPGMIVQVHKPFRGASTFETETVVGIGPSGPQLVTQPVANSRETRLGYTPTGNVGLETRFAQRGIGRGARLEVVRPDAQHVWARTSDGSTVVALPLDQANRFGVYERHEVPLATGDRIRITQNGHTQPDRGKKHRLSNGDLRTVAGFTKRGDIRLDNGWVVSRDYGHLTHGYVVTSFAAQGRTTDKVIVAQGSESLAASGREQFYVTASRARDEMVLITDDKRRLREQVIRNSSRRMSATELVEQHGLEAREADRVEAGRRVGRVMALVKRAREYARQQAEAIRRQYDRVREALRREPKGGLAREH